MSHTPVCPEHVMETVCVPQKEQISVHLEKANDTRELVAISNFEAGEAIIVSTTAPIMVWAYQNERDPDNPNKNVVGVCAVKAGNTRIFFSKKFNHLYVWSSLSQYMGDITYMFVWRERDFVLST